MNINNVLIDGTGGEVAGIQALIEGRLHVETRVEHVSDGMWSIIFETQDHPNLDFLRPHVLQPLYYRPRRKPKLPLFASGEHTGDCGRRDPHMVPDECAVD